MSRWLFGLILILSTALAASSIRAASPLKADHIVVLKHKRLLLLMRNAAVMKQYRVALGVHPTGPLRREGDGRTPEGSYIIDRRVTLSHYHLALHISYPGPADQILKETRARVPPDAIPTLRLGLKLVYSSASTDNAAGPSGRSHAGVTSLSEVHRADEAEIILLVDDNRLVRSSLAMMLEDLGYGVIEAETAQQALAALGTTDQIDTALLDFRLPDMNGVELAVCLRGLKADLPLLMISGQPVGPSDLARIPGPPVGMLLKPFSALELEDLLYALKTRA